MRGRKRLSQIVPYIGCDPEMFVEIGGKIVGSDRVIPEKGLRMTGSDTRVGVEYGPADNYRWKQSDGPRIVRDGVQIELNPNPHSCRANLGNEIAFAMRKLKDHLEKNHAKLNFSSVIELSKDDMAKLSDDAKKLGCLPSCNAHDASARVSVDGATYNRRSAGGHLHFGYHAADPNLLAKVMDVVLGNTCVLIDRDPYAAERRKVYGRAGEYRVPAHGFEYRTLSNFWMRSYQLMSFVTGMGRLAVSIYNSSLGEDLLAEIDPSRVALAINTNDFSLARDSHLQFRDWLGGFMEKDLDRDEDDDDYDDDDDDDARNAYAGGYAWSFAPCMYPAFDHFVAKGLDYWFPEDPFTHWCNLPEGHGLGWEWFIESVVTADMREGK